VPNSKGDSTKTQRDADIAKLDRPVPAGAEVGVGAIALGVPH